MGYNSHHHLHHRRPLSQYETAGNRYTDTVRSYGSAADELESPVPNARVIDYVQQQQPIVYSKPTATVAPSMMTSQAAAATCNSSTNTGLATSSFLLR